MIKSQNLIYVFLLIFFLVFISAGTIYWTYMNKAPYQWDQSWYLEMSELMYHPLKSGSFLEFWNAYQNSFYGIKAPLVSLLYVPSYFLVGHGKPGIILTLLVFIVSASVLIYMLALDYSRSSDIALISVLIFNLMPLSIGLSREVFVEFPMTILVLLWILLKRKSKDFTLLSANLGLGFLLGAGLLMKITFPLFIIGPMLVTLTKRIFTFQPFALRNRKELLALIYELLTISIPMIIVSSTWYLKNWKTIFKFAYSTSFGEIAQDYSYQGSLPQTILTFWKRIISDGFSVYFVVIGIFILLFFLIKSRKFWENKFIDIEELVELALWFFIPFLIFSLGTNKTVRFIFPIVPSFSIMLSLLIWTAFAFSKKKYFLVTAVLLLPLYAYINLTFLLPWETNINWNGWNLISTNHAYSHRPDTQIWPHLELLRFIDQDFHKTDWKELAKQPNYVMVMPNINYFNQNNFRYYSRLTGIGEKGIEFVGMETNSEEDWNNIIRSWMLSGKYIITKTGQQGVLGTYKNLAIMDALDRHEFPFEKIKEFILPDGSVSSVYRKIITKTP